MFKRSAVLSYYEQSAS